MDDTKAPKPERTPEGSLALPDERLFKEGACHAFALELAAAFARVGAAVSFYYLPSSAHHAIAEHVVVRRGENYFDVDFGPQSESQVIARWAAKTAAVLLPVEHPGWISSRSKYSENTSYLGLHIESGWLAQARARAKAFICLHKDRFGL